MPRAIMSGTVSFGLVSIPVKVVAAVREHKLQFHRLSPDGSCRLRTKLYCPEDGHEYEYGEVARGYEIAPDRYVLVDDEELAALAPQKSRAIEILDFVDLSEVDPIYFDRPYHLVPDKGGAKPYRLLSEAMKQSGRVGIARFLMRSREHLAVLRPFEAGLVLSTMHYQDEVEVPSEIEGLADDVAVSDKELDMATRLIDSMLVEFDVGAYRDEYHDAVEAMLARKAEGEVITAPSAEAKPRGKVIDLMDALKQSLAAGDRASRPSRPGPKRAGSSRTTKKGATKKRAGGS